MLVAVPAATVPAFEEAFALDQEAAISSFEIPGSALWSVEAISERVPDREAMLARLGTVAQAMALPVPALSIEQMPERDWVAESLRHLQPVRAGRFFVHGAHDRALRPAGAIGLEVEAGRAFGTGHHETTYGCLLLLDAIARQRRARSILDVGCGTGVLAMAAAALWRRPVTASDIDPVAVRVAQANARANRVVGLVRPLTAIGLAHPALRRGAPYDLILANILARPLVTLAPQITHVAAATADVILAGLLRQQAREILAVYRLLGWRRKRRIDLGPWSILQLSRDARR